MKRTALVTGGNRGIGLAIARQLAELGMTVLLGARDLHAGEQAAASLTQLGFDVLPVRMDLSEPATLDAALEHFNETGVGIDVLVNNAGVLHEKSLLELTDAEVAESLADHVTGPLRLVRALAPQMSSRGYRRIVNLSSGWGSFGEGLGGPEIYGVTKAALNPCAFRKPIIRSEELRYGLGPD
jgi:NAD(P)-dependent dehydrogenase (short-subunit alcohol dehydrogenase family)